MVHVSMYHAHRYMMLVGFCFCHTRLHLYTITILMKVHVFIRIRQSKIERKRDYTTSCLSKTEEKSNWKYIKSPVVRRIHNREICSKLFLIFKYYIWKYEILRSPIFSSRICILKYFKFWIIKNLKF